MDVHTQHSHPHDERNNETVPAIVCLDLTIDVRKQCVRETGWTYRAKLVLEVVASMRGQGHVVKVEPYLPEPATEPTTFLAGASDGFLVKRRLASRGVKVDNTEQARLWREDIVDAIEERIKVWDLKEVSVQVLWMNGRRETLTMESE